MKLESIIEACILQIPEDGKPSPKCQNVSREAKINDSVVRSRILLQGPSKSGKSSLVMDFALSLASKEPCRCTSIRDNIFQVVSDCTDQSCQNCLAITLFVPAQRDRPFPLLCEPLDLSHSDINNLMKDDKFDSNIDRSSKQTELKINRASKRIHVRHVTSISEIISYLLSVTGRPIEDQPFGGIVIDDVDVLCSHQDPATSIIRMSQVVAIMIDTVETIYRSNKFPLNPRKVPFVILTTSNEARRQNIPCPFWTPMILNIRQNFGSGNSALNMINSKNGPHPINGFSSEDFDTVLSGWSVENFTGENRENESIIDYAVVQKWDSNLEIQWKLVTRKISN